MGTVKEDAQRIITESIRHVQPDKAVEHALLNMKITGNVFVVSIGKAAWIMARAAKNIIGDSVQKGIVITKYHHSKGVIGGFEIIEAGHPVPDENSVLGTAHAIEMISGLTKEDQVIFLVSGGGSALFEKPAPGITLDDMKLVTGELLKCGADIIEINTIRKHLSDVKGGKFAELCAPATVHTIVLSDVIGDRLDSIASGPAYPDSSTVSDVLRVIKKYALKFRPAILEVLSRETPKYLDNVDTIITGSVGELCKAAAKSAETLGYTPHILSQTLEVNARAAGYFLSSMAREIRNGNPYGMKAPCALIFGGETTVLVKGRGLGGRNQEVAYTAAKGIAGLKDTLLFSLGSDGTDGPTDAAGGMVDGETYSKILSLGMDYEAVLEDNDTYHGLEAVDGLIKTGATGTNVNDIMVILCR